MATVTPHSKPDLGTRYSVGHEIGRGAMGTVYSARDQHLDREVAIKVLHRAISEPSVERRRFLREAGIVAAIKHPSVVAVFDLGFDAQGHPFLVMERLYGVSLHARLRERALPFHEAVVLTMELLGALSAAHRSGVAHRDIKPANIILANEWGETRVKLIDFGLSRRFTTDEDRITASGTAVGTPPYMAPEQILGQTLGTAADVYSVGCTLFEMLTRRPPFPMASAPNVASLFHQIVTGTAPLVSKHRADVPAELDRIVARALATHIDERYATCEAMRDALARFLPLASKLPPTDETLNTWRPPDEVPTERW